MQVPLPFRTQEFSPRQSPGHGVYASRGVGIDRRARRRRRLLRRRRRRRRQQAPRPPRPQALSSRKRLTATTAGKRFSSAAASASCVADSAAATLGAELDARNLADGQQARTADWIFGSRSIARLSESSRNLVSSCVFPHLLLLMLAFSFFSSSFPRF